MSDGTFIALNGGRFGEETAKQAKIGLASLLKTLQIGSRAG
jgi:hypothetical protein